MHWITVKDPEPDGSHVHRYLQLCSCRWRHFRLVNCAVLLRQALAALHGRTKLASTDLYLYVFASYEESKLKAHCD